MFDLTSLMHKTQKNKYPDTHAPMLYEDIAQFSANLTKNGRIMSLDVGDKTIGLAISDRMRSIATPLSTIRRSKFKKDMTVLQSSISEHDVVGLIVGLPLNMDGSSGPRVQSTRTFISNLSKHIDLPIALWDERLSTVAVQRTMLDADLSRARRAELVDKLAASYMLQGFLDQANM